MSTDIRALGFDKEKIAAHPDPEYVVAWVLCQILDDDAPLRWSRHLTTARCLVGSFDMKLKVPL
jgi:hypothetical protein